MARKKKTAAPPADPTFGMTWPKGHWPKGHEPSTHVAPPDVMDRIRDAWVQGTLVPWIAKVFARNPEIQSGMFFVSQYWNDEANDAVHEHFTWWKTREPSPEYVSDYGSDLPKEMVASPNYPTPPGQSWGNGLTWDDNWLAITLFATFCNESGSQEDETGEGWEPYARIMRHEGRVQVEFVGKKLRPEIDGLRCDWEREYRSDDGRWLSATDNDQTDEDEGASRREHMLSDIAVDTDRVERLRGLGIEVTSVRDLHIVDPWVSRALAVADEELVAASMTDESIRNRIEAMLRTGGKVREERTGRN